MEFQTKSKSKVKWLAIALIVLGLLIALTFAAFTLKSSDQIGPEVTIVSTLKKIINVSELSTFTAVYNGIAEVMNTEKPEKVDYYVSYEARIEAGIDFECVDISIDDEAMAIIMDIPDVYITDINVDIASLEFIFINDSANTSSVTEEAYKACELDVQTESDQNNAIYDLAKQNAVNVLTALTNPIIEQQYGEYTLTIN